MSEPTIQELIQELIGEAVRFGHTGLIMKKTKSDSIKDAGDALLSRITHIQQENKELWEALTKIKEITIELTVMNSALKDAGDMPERSTKNFYSEIKRMSGLIFDITTLQQEAESAKTDYELLSNDYKQLGISLEKAKQEVDEWHKMADEFAVVIKHYDTCVGCGWNHGEGHADDCPMTAYRTLSQCYSHAHPSEDTSVEGTKKDGEK